MKLTLTPEMKARIKAFLISLTATTQRKLIVSTVISALGAIGLHEIAPETVDGWLTMVLTAVQTFILY